MLVDLLDGGFMGDPSRVEVSNGDSSLLEVIVILPTDTSHDLLEAGQFILEIFNSMVKDVQGGRLLAYHLPKFVGLEKAISG